MLLTDTRLKHLKPSSKDLNLSDGRGTQLYCRVKPNGLKTFIFRYCYHGRASNISLGKYPATISPFLIPIFFKADAYNPTFCLNSPNVIELSIFVEKS